MIVYYFTEYDVAMQPGLAEAGWNGRGWYFWDEAQTVIYGPYPDEGTAFKYGDEYAVALNKRRTEDSAAFSKYGLGSDGW